MGGISVVVPQRTVSEPAVSVRTSLPFRFCQRGKSAACHPKRDALAARTCELRAGPSGAPDSSKRKRRFPSRRRVAAIPMTLPTIADR